MSATAAPGRKARAAKGLAAPVVLERRRVGRLGSLSASTNRLVQVTGVLFAIVIAGHLVWLATSFNTRSPVIASLFAVAILLVDIYAALAIVNAWHIARPTLRLLERGGQPTVAVLIPTCGEPISMLIATIRSVVEQDWPRTKLVIVVGDDRNQRAVRSAVRRFASKERVSIHYLVPPEKGSPLRRGEAKAGNLNACLDFLKATYPSVELIETRDADDLVGQPDFLRLAVAHLLDNPDASFVQTIKRCQVPDGDPFSSQEPAFYERVMLTRQACNATFPCGSGLVWRRSGLDLIGGFPTWNLVEDLDSGYELFRRGGRGLYLPILGSIAQAAPEDVPNLYKQRGTWALDSARLFLFKNPLFVRGLSWRQRFQFLELNFSYIASFGHLFFIVTILASLFADVYPTTGSALQFFIAMIALTVASEVFYSAKAGHISFREQWRSRQVSICLMFLYMASFGRALRYGPRRKPQYVVTRKHSITGWHWKYVVPQTLTVVLLVAAIAYAVGFRSDFSAADLGSVFWALFFIQNLFHVVRLSWSREAETGTKVSTSPVWRAFEAERPLALAHARSEAQAP
jgi:cellulose synthase (UDP-forming)